MGLADALDEAAAEMKRKGPRCTVGELLESLDEGDAEKLRAVIDGPLPSGRWLEATGIVRVLKSNGYDGVSSTSVQRHRRRIRGTGDSCQCPI